MFNKIVNERTEKIKSTLLHKAKEYATNADRYHNFNITGRILDITPERALIGMWMKHVVSVLDLVDWIEDAPDKLTTEIIDEKITDTAAYLILLEGLLKKRIEDEK